MTTATESWVIRVKAAAHCEPVIVGNVVVDKSGGRAAAKLAAKAFVWKHFDEQAKIIGIARGYLTLQLEGPWETVNA